MPADSSSGDDGHRNPTAADRRPPEPGLPGRRTGSSGSSSPSQSGCNDGSQQTLRNHGLSGDHREPPPEEPWTTSSPTPSHTPLPASPLDPCPEPAPPRAPPGSAAARHGHRDRAGGRRRRRGRRVRDRTRLLRAGRTDSASSSSGRSNVSTDGSGGTTPIPGNGDWSWSDGGQGGLTVPTDPYADPFAGQGQPAGFDDRQHRPGLRFPADRPGADRLHAEVRRRPRRPAPAWCSPPTARSSPTTTSSRAPPRSRSR